MWDHFLKEMSGEMGVPTPQTQPAAAEMLAAYDWPGNVRELKNVVQRLLFAGAETLTAELVKNALRPIRKRFANELQDTMFQGADGAALPWRTMERVLREKYFRYIRERSRSDAEAAKKLGLAPPNYHRMCKEMGIKS